VSNDLPENCSKRRPTALLKRELLEHGRRAPLELCDAGRLLAERRRV